MADNVICLSGKKSMKRILRLDHALPLALHSLKPTAAQRALKIPRAESYLQDQIAYVNHQLAVVHFQGTYIHTTNTSYEVSFRGESIQLWECVSSCCCGELGQMCRACSLLPI